MEFKPPKVAGTCDACGGKLVQRNDDGGHGGEAPRAYDQADRASSSTTGTLKKIDGDGEMDAVWLRVRRRPPRSGCASVSMRPVRDPDMRIYLKTKEEIAKLREADLVVAEVLDAVAAAARPRGLDVGAGPLAHELCKLSAAGPRSSATATRRC